MNRRHPQTRSRAGRSHRDVVFEDARWAALRMPTIRLSFPHAEYAPDLGSWPRSKRTSGTSLCEAMIEHGVDIEHACEMSCACTTCHVVVREGFSSLGDMDESEEDLLDRAWGWTPTSRLSCQAIVSERRM